MKKLLFKILLIISCICLSLSLFACFDSANISESSEQDNPIVAIYNTYVEYAKANNTKPLSYEEWLTSIKGQNGKNGLSAYEIYKSYHPDYTKTEKEFIEDLSNGKLQTQKHTVTFEIENGSPYTTQSVLHGGKIEKPNAPVKDGSYFIGWYIDDEEWIFPVYTITEDIILTAKWEKIATAGLEYYPLSDGTYGVKAGTAFYLDNIIIPSEHNGKPVTKILDHAFESSPIQSITLPDTISTIEDYAFKNCENLNITVLPDQLNTIGNHAFEGCASISTIILPVNLTKIGAYAFSDCKKITTIIIPVNVNEIGSYAFYGSNLQSAIFESYDNWNITFTHRKNYSDYNNETVKENYDLSNPEKAATALTTTVKILDYKHYSGGSNYDYFYNEYEYFSYTWKKNNK